MQDCIIQTVQHGPQQANSNNSLKRSVFVVMYVFVSHLWSLCIVLMRGGKVFVFRM